MSRIPFSSLGKKGREEMSKAILLGKFLNPIKSARLLIWSVACAHGIRGFMCHRSVRSVTGSIEHQGVSIAVYYSIGISG
jgi:hypothetical protein